MPDLLDFLESAAKSLDVTDAVLGDVADAFESVNLKTLGRFEARPILLGTGNGAALDALHSRMIDEGMDDEHSETNDEDRETGETTDNRQEQPQSARNNTVETLQSSSDCTRLHTYFFA